MPNRFLIFGALLTAFFSCSEIRAQNFGLKRYSDTGNLQIQKTINLNNGNRVWIANHGSRNPLQPTEPSFSGIIQCTDVDMQRVWSVKMPKTNVYNVAATATSSILVSGSVINGGPLGSEPSSFFVLCLSADGTFLWRRDLSTSFVSLNTPIIGSKSLIIPLRSGNFFLVAPLDRAGRFVMAKFDATGEFLWQKQVVFPRSLHFSDGVQDFEGNVLLGANDEDGYTTNNARLIAIDTMGEFKYSRLIDRQGFILWHLLPSNLSSSIFIVGFEPSNRFFNTIYKLQGPARTETSMPYVSFYETRRPCNPIALNFTIDSSDAIYGLPGGRSFSGLTGVPNIRDSAGWYKPWLACKFDSDLNPVWAKQFVLPLGNNGSTGFIGYLNHGLVSGDRVLAGISYLEDLPPLIPSIETRRAVSGFMVLDTAGSMGDCLAVKDSLAIQRGSVAIAPITLSFSDAPQAVTVGFGSMFPVNNSTVFEKDSCVSKRGPRSKFGVYSTTNGSDIINVVCTQTAVTFFDSSYWEPQTWQWVFPPEADLSAADSSCYPTVRNVRFTQAGVFPVQLITQNESGTDTTTINVTVINFIPQPLLGNDTTICEGDSVRLVYTPVENSGHYFLKLGGGFFSTEDTVFIKQGGAYICAAFSPCGFRYDTINITVLRRPLARFGYSDSCGRLQVFFSDSSETGGSAGMEYRWEFFDKNDIELGSSALQNPSFTFPSFDTVRVRLIINSGQPCLFADTVWQTIVLRPKPVASFTTTETCGSLTASFSNSSSIAAGSIVRHHWAFGDGNSSSALEPVHTFPSFSSFPVKLVVESGAGCLSDTVSQTLTIRAKPQASITYNNDACESQAFTLVNTASAEASTIQDHYWRILPTAQVFTTPGIEPSLPAGSYTVQYTALSAQGCPSDTVQKLITVESIPSVSLRDTSGCTGTALALSAEVLQPFGSIASYSWQAGDQSSTESSPSFSFTAAGSYPIQLTVQSLNGCTGTGSAITEIEAIPRPSFNYSPPCLGEEVRFTNTSDGIASFAWQWSINASPVSQAPSLSYTFPSAGEYTVSLRGLSPGGCTASVSKTVRVADFSLSLSASQNPAYEGDELRIETRAALPYSVVGWQPAFLFSTSSAISQQVTADSTRLYQVVAEAAGGCRDTASVLVRVEPLDDVYIPSAFTPNGDGLNDVLRVVGAGMSEFSFAIYNRWGRVVYHSRNKGEGWNGQLNGSPAPAGSYAYLLQATKGDKKILKRGTVTLIR